MGMNVTARSFILWFDEYRIGTYELIYCSISVV